MSEAGFVCIGQVAECFSGYPFESKEFCPPGEGEARVFRGDNLKEGCSEWGAKEKRWKAISPGLEKYQLKQNDVLVGMDGSKVGKNWTRVDKGDLPALLGQRVCRIRAGEFADQDFIFHVFGSYDFKSYVECVKTGTSIPHISNTQIRDFGVFLPPLPEQKKIAEILSGIDLRIRLGTQRVAQLETLLRSLGDKFFGHQSHHETKTIGQIFEVSSGTTPSRSRQDYFCTNGGTPWVKTMDLTDDYVRTTDEQLTSTGIHEGRAKIFPKGTLLIAMYGGWNQIGRTGILTRDSSCNQAMSALLPAKEVSPEFLNLQLLIRRSYWKGVAASSRKDPNITKLDVTDMPISVPADHIQAEITNALSSVLHQKRTEYSYLQNLNLLKNALASDLLSGRKRVSI